MILISNLVAVALIDLVFLAYAFVRILLSYLILTKALERKDSRGYKFLALSFIVPIVAYIIYMNILKKEELA